MVLISNFIKLFTFFIFNNFKTSLAVSSNIAKRDHDNHYKQSYDQVTAYAKRFFNTKCELRVINCMYQYQWDRIFGCSTSGSGQKRQGHDDLKTCHCQAFIVARQCIDYELKKSYAENFECINGTNGNQPGEFHKAIQRPECKQDYSRFSFILSNSASQQCQHFLSILISLAIITRFHSTMFWWHQK